jgi:hypothetical protein
VLGTKSVIFPFCALLSVLAAAQWLRLSRRDRDPSRLALVCYSALLGLTFTLSTPNVSAGLDRVVGVPNLSAFLIHVSAVTASFTAQVLIDLWSGTGPSIRRRVLGRLLLLAVFLSWMSVAFWLIAVGSGPRQPDFFLAEERSGGGPYFRWYFVGYLLALSVGIFLSARLCWRYARVCARPRLRRGLRTATLGFYLTFCYCLVRFVGLFAHDLHTDPSRWEVLVPIFSGAGVTLTLVGFLLPTLCASWQTARERHERRALYRRLDPLWRALHAAGATSTLDTPRPRWLDLNDPRDLDHRMVRHVVEIWDGLLAITPFIPPDAEAIAQKVATLTSDARMREDDAVQAIRVHAALVSFAAQVDHPAPDAGTHGSPSWVGSDFHDEALRLATIADAYRRLPHLQRLQPQPRGDLESSSWFRSTGT